MWRCGQEAGRGFNSFSLSLALSVLYHDLEHGDGKAKRNWSSMSPGRNRVERSRGNQGGNTSVLPGCGRVRRTGDRPATKGV
jgi:hypothetical protein